MLGYAKVRILDFKNITKGVQCLLETIPECTISKAIDRCTQETRLDGYILCLTTCKGLTDLFSTAIILCK